MKLIYGVLLFVGVFALNNASSSTTLKRLATDQLLMQHLMGAIKSDQSVAVQCFQLYTPIIDAILEEYSRTYLICNTTAETHIEEVNKKASANQTLISKSAQDVCNKMTACSTLESLEFFDCYANEGNGNTKTIWGLSNSAISDAAYLREEYQLIQYTKSRCQNISEETYVLDTTAAIEALQYCLANGPPEIVSTSAVPVETTTNNDIISTEKPLTTNVPQRTTEAVPEANGFEEEDLSRSAPLTVPKKNKGLGEP